MKVAVTAFAVVCLAAISLAQKEKEPSASVANLFDSFGPEEHADGQHQPESFLESSEGLVRNKRQFYGGYGGYRGGYGRGFGGGYGGYGRGFGGGYGGYRGGYGGGYRSYGGYRGGYGYGGYGR